MDRASWVLGLGGLSAACLVALPAAAMAAPKPTPTPRCHVVAGPAPSGPSSGGVVVVIPRMACSGPSPVKPTPQPVVHPGGGGVAQPGGGVGPSTGNGGGRPGGGTVPFTGADVARWSGAALVLVAAGSLLVATGRGRSA